MKIVRSSVNVVLAYFLLPYLLFLVALYACLAGNVLHVLAHFTLLGLLAHFVLQVTILVDPELPFSQPIERGRESFFLFVFTVAMGIVSAVLETLSAELYSSRSATVGAFGGLLLASTAVDRLTRVRVERATARREFLG
jgi:hypothetical protein